MKPKLSHKDKLVRDIMSSDFFKLDDNNTSATRRKNNSLGLTMTSSSSSPSTSSSSSRRNRPPIDLSSSKLSLLDNPNFSDPTPHLGKRKLAAIKKKARSATKGPLWYGMKAPEITQDRRNDLDALKLRGALDTKSFYKRNVVNIKPKHFQVGKIVETKADWFNSRLTKKQRKATIADEFMAELH